MKIKTLLAVSSAMGLVACGTSVLWTSVIDGANLSGPALPIATQDNSVYQLYPIDTQLQLRKLDSKGVVLWQIPVDETVASNITEPKLGTWANGVIVGYQDSTNKLAYVKSFDVDGGLLWSSDLGEHTSETLDDMAATTDGGATLAIRLSSSLTNVLHYDNTGALQWETPIPACSAPCTTTIGVNAAGETLANNTEWFATKSYLLDTMGTQLWYKRRGTGVTTLGLIPNKITPTSDGFAVLHPLASWHYDMAGNQTWSYGSGSQANIVTDGSGNFYVPGVGKVSKLDSTGTLVSEIDLSGESGLRQLQWREDLQRLVVLSTTEDIGPEIDATITASTAFHLSLYDAAGTRTARYNGTATKLKSSLCPTYPLCTQLSVIQGENWSQFATTLDGKLVVSGNTVGSERFAKAFKMP